MVRRSLSRAVVATLLAAALVGLVPSFALAWDASCVTGKVCVWLDRDFVLPLAAQVGTNDNYGTAKYPNTNIVINNSASSVANYYTSKDIVFYTGTNGSGTSFCVDSWYQYSWVGLGLNDSFSSHSVTINDGLCFT